MEQKFPVRNFQMFGFTSQGFPILRKFGKMLFHSPLQISRNSIEWKVLYIEQQSYVSRLFITPTKNKHFST